MLGKAKNHVEAVFKRVYRWTLEIPDILKEQFVKITPATEYPFGDLNIWMSIASKDIDDVRDNLPQSKTAIIKRYDGCGTLMEEWNVDLHRVYDIRENTDQDDPYGDMEFKVKWTEVKKV